MIDPNKAMADSAPLPMDGDLTPTGLPVTSTSEHGSTFHLQVDIAKLQRQLGHHPQDHTSDASHICALLAAHGQAEDATRLLDHQPGSQRVDP